jgi:hypothetical protein
MPLLGRDIVLPACSTLPPVPAMPLNCLHSSPSPTAIVTFELLLLTLLLIFKYCYAAGRLLLLYCFYCYFVIVTAYIRIIVLYYIHIIVSYYRLYYTLLRLLLRLLKLRHQVPAL